MSVGFGPDFEKFNRAKWALIGPNAVVNAVVKSQGMQKHYMSVGFGLDFEKFNRAKWALIGPNAVVKSQVQKS